MNEIKQFEDIISNAKLKALQKVSLKRPLTDKEFKLFKELALKRIG